MYGFYTDIGGRGNNEDSLLAIESGGAYLFAVADGLGGHEAGEVASRILVDELRRAFMKTPYSFDLEQSVKRANALILSEQDRTGKKMKTTVSAAYVFGGRTYVANVGDSRVYLFDEGNIVFTSVDHSVAQMAVHAGEITADKIRSHPDRNILTRALGSAAGLKVDMYTVDNSTYDRLLICSDGFWEHVLESQMTETARANASPDAWIGAMRRFRDADAPDGGDNNTAVAMVKSALETHRTVKNAPDPAADNAASPDSASGKSSGRPPFLTGLLIALICLGLIAIAASAAYLAGFRGFGLNNAQPADPTGALPALARKFLFLAF